MFVVILSEAKLQRGGRSPRGQAFNLRSSLPSSTGDHKALAAVPIRR